MHFRSLLIIIAIIRIASPVGYFIDKTKNNSYVVDAFTPLPDFDFNRRVMCITQMLVWIGKKTGIIQFIRIALDFSHVREVRSMDEH